MWKKYCTAEQATDDNMAHAHYILDTYGYKHTHSGCVKLIAFSQQQWLHESTSVLRYTLPVLLVYLSISKTTASPQLRTIRGHPCAIKRRLNAVHTSRVLAVRHQTHSRGPFKKPLVKGGNLQVGSPVNNRQKK